MAIMFGPEGQGGSREVPRFQGGRYVMTAEAFRVLDPADVKAALDRHHRGDWGDLCPEDRQANDDALKTGERLLSAYQDRNRRKFWIITEADRSVTTVLLPEDY